MKATKTHTASIKNFLPWVILGFLAGLINGLLGAAGGCWQGRGSAVLTTKLPHPFACPSLQLCLSRASPPPLLPLEAHPSTILASPANWRVDAGCPGPN